MRFLIQWNLFFMIKFLILFSYIFMSGDSQRYQNGCKNLCWFIDNKFCHVTSLPFRFKRQRVESFSSTVLPTIQARFLNRALTFLWTKLEACPSYVGSVSESISHTAKLHAKMPLTSIRILCGIASVSPRNGASVHHATHLPLPHFIHTLHKTTAASRLLVWSARTFNHARMSSALSQLRAAVRNIAHHHATYLSDLTPRTFSLIANVQYQTYAWYLICPPLQTSDSSINFWLPFSPAHLPYQISVDYLFALCLASFIVTI